MMHGGLRASDKLRSSEDGFRDGAANDTKGGTRCIHIYGRNTSQSRVSRPERKCHGSALISSWHIIQFRFNLVIRRLRLLVKHDGNESVAFGTNHKHAPSSSNPSLVLRFRIHSADIFFFVPRAVEILFVIHFIRFAWKKGQPRRFVSIKWDRIPDVKIAWFPAT